MQCLQLRHDVILTLQKVEEVAKKVIEYIRFIALLDSIPVHGSRWGDKSQPLCVCVCVGGCVGTVRIEQLATV